MKQNHIKWRFIFWPTYKCKKQFVVPFFGLFLHLSISLNIGVSDYEINWRLIYMSICMSISLCYLNAPKIVPSFYVSSHQPVPARLLEELSLAGSAIPLASHQKLLFNWKCETYPMVISFSSPHQPFLLIDNHIDSPLCSGSLLMKIPCSFSCSLNSLKSASSTFGLEVNKD